MTWPLTGWYGSDQKPARVGVFLTRFGEWDDLWMAMRWDGSEWTWIDGTRCDQERGREFSGLAFDSASATDYDQAPFPRGWWVPKP